MTSPLLHPPAHLSPAEALQLSQQAPLLLQKAAPSSGLSEPSRLLSQIYNPETADTWIIYENLFLSCLRTRDDKSAAACLRRLTDRFGGDNERVMGLSGMYREAVAADDAELEKILKDYEKVLKEHPTNMPVAKRRIALLRSLSRPNDAIAALVELLDSSPTDAEAWAELSELYFSQNLFQQAIFSLEEVLLIMPNAWNMHARMGEVVYASGLAVNPPNDTHMEKTLVDSLRWYCRSVELCEDYLRGFYGLKLTTGHLLSLLTKRSSSTITAKSQDVPPPSVKEVEKLNEVATAKLSEIVRRSAARESGWTGYDLAEVIAARELLDRDVQPVER